MTLLASILKDGEDVPMAALRNWLANVAAQAGEAALVVATAELGALVDDRVYDTHAQLPDAAAAGLYALVTLDPNEDLIGLWKKTGAAGSPGWDGPSQALRGPGLSSDQKTKLDSLDPPSINAALEYTNPLSPLGGDEYLSRPLPPESGFKFAFGDASRRIGAGMRLDGSWGSNAGPDAPYSIVRLFSDSFGQGVGPNHQWWQHMNYMLAAAGDTRHIVKSFSSGGQDASQIAGRMGARSILITLAGNTIPASGSVVVTDITPQILTSTTDAPQPGGPQICRLAINPGIWGTLQRNPDGSYLWYRETPGDAVAIPENTAARADGFFNRKTNVIIAAGRNTENFDLAIIRQEIDAMRRMQTASLDMSMGGIIVGFTNASTIKPDGTPSGYGDESNGTARNAALYTALDDLAFTYGDDFIDVQRYSLANAIRDLDILHGQGYFDRFYGDGGPGTLTPWPTHKAAYAAQDAADIAAGVIPTSLRYDGLHPNTYWGAVIAQLVFRRFRSKRY